MHASLASLRWKTLVRQALDALVFVLVPILVVLAALLGAHPPSFARPRAAASVTRAAASAGVLARPSSPALEPGSARRRVDGGGRSAPLLAQAPTSASIAPPSFAHAPSPSAPSPPPSSARRWSRRPRGPPPPSA